ncbi:MAG TPA: hypothetical protein VES20_20570 [Bryobacteraceae bacterium]|nr:hypothetical protein [Bryobacteraceae bacterium]
MKSLLSFRNYYHLDSGYIRGREGEVLTLLLAASMSGRFQFRVSDEDPGQLRFEVEI